MNRGSFGCLAAAGLMALPLSGCVVNIGNGGPDRTRVHLSQDEMASVRVVTSSSEVRSFREAHAAELGKLTPATTLDEFRAMFPGTCFVERRGGEPGPIDAYSVAYKDYYRYRGSSRAYVHEETVWFFFRDGKFAKWDDEKRWP